MYFTKTTAVIRGVLWEPVRLISGNSRACEKLMSSCSVLPSGGIASLIISPFFNSTIDNGAVFTLKKLSKTFHIMCGKFPAIYQRYLGVQCNNARCLSIIFWDIRAGKPALLLSVPFMPLYWFALCAPTIRALWELRRKPFHWHKTEHGITSTTHALENTAWNPN